MRQLKLAVIALASLTASTVLAQDGWVDLFNGTNLDGWGESTVARPKYDVENGELVGESVAGSGNSFLCTKQRCTKISNWSWNIIAMPS